MKFPKSAAIIFITIAAVVAIVVTVTRVHSTAISKASGNVATGIPVQAPGATAGSLAAAPGFQATATGISLQVSVHSIFPPVLMLQLQL
jgi:hypothetical protein